MEHCLYKEEELKSSGIEKYLQGVFISEEIGYNKPSIEYFEKLFFYRFQILRRRTQRSLETA